MKNVRLSDQPISSMNIVPIIGVALILLVILVVMSPIMNLPDLEVDLPEAVTKESKEENLTVSLGLDGRVSIETQIIDDWNQIPERLREALLSRERNTAVIVRADKNLPYGLVERLVRIVNRNAGGNPVALATKQRTEALNVGEQEQ